LGIMWTGITSPNNGFMFLLNMAEAIRILKWCMGVRSFRAL